MYATRAFECTQDEALATSQSLSATTNTRWKACQHGVAVRAPLQRSSAAARRRRATADFACRPHH